MDHSKPNWRNWLRPWEAATLAKLAERQAESVAERKRIRDRCYARARRSEAKET